jgi:chitodextrinase
MAGWRSPRDHRGRYTSRPFPRVLLAAAVAILVPLVSVPAASAKRRSIPASARHDHILVFKLDGISPPSVRSGLLRMGPRARLLRVGAVRAAAERGKLRTRVPKSWRESSPRLAKGRKLIVRTDSSAPTAPSGLVATPGDGKLTLTWQKSTDNVGVSGYQVFRANPDGSWSGAAIATTTGTSYTDSGLLNGTAYTYRVVAYDAAGNRSAASDTASATPSAPAPAPAPAPLPEGARFVSPSGSDSNPGTQSAPWRTLAKAISAARPGDTVVFRAGTYGARGTNTIADTSGSASAPITFRGYPDEPKPEILGRLKIAGSYLNFDGFLFNGPTGDVGGNAGCAEHPGESVLVDIGGSNDKITHSEVRNSYGNAGIYVAADSGTGISISHNWIHDNGGFGVCGQTLVNGQHGIYWHRGQGRIYDNVIEHNWTRGVQLYSDAHNVVVEYNHIVWNGRAGVIQGGSSSDNVVSDNIVAGNAWNGQCGIYDYNGAALLVTHNVVWHNYDSNTCGSGMTVSANVTADPLFVDADVDSPPAPLRVDRRWTVGEAGSADYHLGGGSPAIDRASSTYLVAGDYDGVVRPQGVAPDIGAFEAR